ncbi:MAG: nucleotidyltransferase domain-containing protein [Deltaproteobacteria bacterium]|nr:nucleotidyltransferase domain-containing protein [Deltaproteobacteria bacterium]
MDFNDAEHQSFFAAMMRHNGIAAFFLFGSHARGRVRRDSDLDLAYLPSRDLSSTEEDAVHLALMDHVKCDRLDVVNLRAAPLLLRFAVIRHGRCIAARNPDAVTQFIFETRRDYLDTQYLRAVFARYQQQRIAHGAFGAAR